MKENLPPMRITRCMVTGSQYHDKTDEELIRLTIENQAIFAMLIDRYEPKLRRYIHRIATLSKEDGEDILQEIFLKIYKNLHGYDPSLSFSSWAYRISHNHVRSHHRKKMARPQTSGIDETIIETIADDIHISEQTDRQLLQEAIGKSLKKLDTKYSTVLILKFLEEKNYKEISDILQKPEGTVGTLINRAKKKLRSELEKNNIVL